MKKLLLVFLIFILAAQLLGLSLVYASNDPVGNITEIDDNSYTDARKLATFAYDDLYRLTSASSTDAGVELYYETYAYDSIGNITNKSDQGTYTYNDDGYNNPHAADSIDGVNLAYDNAGNLTSDGNLTLVWDYRNRLASASSTTDSITYAYDHNNQRTEITNGSSITTYPNKLYNTDGTTETKHIFDHEGTVIATAETAASSTKVYYNHPDHLTGSNVISNEAGALEQTIDYYPFGGIRVNDRNSVFDEQRKFTGQEYDEDTNLHYYGARYYNQDIGRFVSQDLVFLAVGTGDKRVNIALQNPQFLNSYSYVGNNPLKYVDEEGEFPFLIPVLVIAAIYAPAVLPSLPALFDNPDITARMTPGLGDALDAGEAVSGRDAFTGQQLSGFDRALSAGGTFLPFVSGGQLRAGYKAFTSLNFRENLTRFTGNTPQGFDAHHILPQKFQSQFEKAGVNIHDPKYGAWWGASEHRGKAYEYNKSWDQFFSENTSPTVEQVENKAREVAKEFDIEANF